MNGSSASERTIDLNADMGESIESLPSGTDRELMQFITSANIACGGHAGDEQTMRATLELAKEWNVAVGAHPSYPDRVNFGRLEMKMPTGEIEISVREQIEALSRVASSCGVKLKHVKPHGALYHAASHDREVGLAIGRAVRAVNVQLIMIGQAGSSCLETWRALGLRTAGEAFADRAYERDGKLRSRKLEGALIKSPEDAAKQSLDIALQGKVAASGGDLLTISAQTICIHSDTPSSPAIARAVRRALEGAGTHVRAM
jgi:5-oxoprolinase (ATP-hydrolysing) subunit A